MQAEKSRHPLPAPLLIPALFTAVGIILGKYSSAPWQAGIWMVAGLLLLALVFTRQRSGWILLLFICLGFFRWHLDEGRSKQLADILVGKGSACQEIIFKVKGPYSEDSYEVELLEIAGLKQRAKLILNSDKELATGQCYQTVADLLPLRTDSVMESYQPKYQAFARPLLLLKPVENGSGKSFLRRINAFIKNRLQALPKQDRDLAEALLLGNPIAKKEQMQLLSRTGLSHLVVVSGLHVVFLYFISIIILRFFLPQRLADAAFLLLILLFAALNQWAAPILRAILMIALAIFARWFSRPLSAAQVFSFSFLTVLLFKPAELFSAGFQLSFAAVATIFFALPKMPLAADSGQINTLVHRLLQFMILSFVVALGLMPFTLYYFGTLSLNSILANLIGIPIIYLLLAIALAIILIPVKPLYLAFSFLAQSWSAALKLCARMPFHIDGAWISAFYSLALALLFIFFVVVFKRKWKVLKYSALPLLIGAALLFFWPNQPQNQVIFFDAKMAECSLILGKQGESLMIDSGGLSGLKPGEKAENPEEIYEKSWMRRQLLPRLKRNGIKRLDYLVITHLHNDHDAGLIPLLKHLKIKNLVLSKASLDSQTWLNLAPHLPLSKTRIICITDTCSIFLGELRLKILHPDASFEAEDENNQSLVCRLDAGESSYLFTGDIEAKAESYLVKNYADELRADFLQVAHHGSRTSSNTAFLRAVQPKEAFISCSFKNVHGFPHAEALGRLYAQNIPLIFSYDGSLSRPLFEKRLTIKRRFEQWIYK